MSVEPYPPDEPMEWMDLEPYPGPHVIELDLSAIINAMTQFGKSAWTSYINVFEATIEIYRKLSTPYFDEAVPAGANTTDWGARDPHLIKDKDSHFPRMSRGPYEGAGYTRHGRKRY